MFLIVLIILIILRTIKLKYQSILRNKVTFTKSILLRKLLNFIKKEVKFLIHNQTIKDNNSKDYLNLFIVNNLNEIKNKYKKTENK